MVEGVQGRRGRAAANRGSRSRWSYGVGVAVIPFLAFALAACGSQQTEAASQQREVPSLTGQDNAGDPQRATKDKLHEFGECMRAAGFNMADPPSLDAVKLPPEAHQGEARTKASRCYQLLPPAELKKADSATMAERLKYARCMRAHGVPETQDPTEEGTVFEQPPVDYSSKRYKDAYKACTGEELETSGSGGPVG